MSLKDKIESDYNKSIKEKDSNSINTLRLIKSAIKDKEISLRGKQDSLTDSDILSLLQSLVKQRKDSIEAFEKANRNDLIEKELNLSLIHISEPTRPLYISYAVFCLKKKQSGRTW